MADPLRAPFPYFGGKSRIAGEVWARLSPPHAPAAHYIEPFGGSAAALLARPDWRSGLRLRETYNDSDGLLANAWRAIRCSPDAVAEHADWPVSELDLTARHRVLVERRAELTERLAADPHWHDPELAGWWIWGRSCWPGGGWGAIRRPRRPHIAGHMDGQGVHQAGVDIRAWMQALSERLRYVRLLCGSWGRAVSTKTLRGGAGRPEVAAVLLDPPYAHAARSYGHGHYAHDNGAVAADARAWALDAGQDQRNRIILCGLTSEHEAHMPSSWERVRWSGGQGQSAGDECLWCSPGCPRPQPELFEHFQHEPEPQFLQSIKKGVAHG